MIKRQQTKEKKKKKNTMIKFKRQSWTSQESISTCQKEQIFSWTKSKIPAQSQSKNTCHLSLAIKK